MEKFIHRQNLALFTKRLAEPGLTDPQRKVIVRLLSEEQAKNYQTTSSTSSSLLAFKRWAICAASVYGLVTCLVAGIAVLLAVGAQPTTSGYSPRFSASIVSSHSSGGVSVDAEASPFKSLSDLALSQALLN